MDLPKRSPEWYTWNVNTWIAIGGFVITLATITIGWGTIYGRATTTYDAKFEAVTLAIQNINADRSARRTENEQKWRDHDSLHKERLAEVKAQEAKTDQKFVQIDEKMRKLDQVDYRTIQLESGAQNLAKSVEELKRSVADQSSDLKVIREILQRQERENGGRRQTFDSQAPQELRR